MLAMAALGALPPNELAQLDRHLTTCDACKNELGVMRDALAEIPLSLPQRAMSPERGAEIRARLEARAIEDRENVSPIRARSTPASAQSASQSSSTRPAFSSTTSTRAARSSGVRWLAAAAMLLAAGSLAYAFSLRSTVARLSVARAELRDSTNQLEKRLANQQAMLDGLTGPGVRVIDAATTSANQPYARMFWDPPTGKWMFVAYNLPAPGSGHTYQVWIITRDQKKLPGPTFDPTAAGAAMVRMTHMLPTDSLTAIAVTSEPAGGSQQPTSAPLLVGSARSE
jgi:anti-sigma-K factor RskA